MLKIGWVQDQNKCCHVVGDIWCFVDVFCPLLVAIKYESMQWVVSLLKIACWFSKLCSTEAIKSWYTCVVSDFVIWGYIASVSGCLLFPYLVSVAEIIMDFDISVLPLDKFSESLLGTSSLLLFPDKIVSFSRAILMSLSSISFFIQEFISFQNRFCFFYPGFQWHRDLMCLQS